jgi:DNA mismatch endonuclease (patch repair protein)
MKKSPTSVDAARRHTMSRIKCKDTAIEISLRKALWQSGIRYRKNYAGLPGVPDIAITKFKIAIFCDGEFWHGKDWGAKKSKIKSNRAYWIPKIERNMDRDLEAGRRLRYMDWIVLRFWGEEISKNLAGCLKEIESVIFERKMETRAKDWEFNDY